VTLFYGVHHVKEWLLPNRVELTILGEKVVEKSVTFLHGAGPYFLKARVSLRTLSSLIINLFT
jgi:hypothetical protein